MIFKIRNKLYEEFDFDSIDVIKHASEDTRNLRPKFVRDIIGYAPDKVLTSMGFTIPKGLNKWHKEIPGLGYISSRYQNNLRPVLCNNWFTLSISDQVTLKKQGFTGLHSCYATNAIYKLKDKFPVVYDFIIEFIKYHTGLENPLAMFPLDNIDFDIFLSPDKGIIIVSRLCFSNKSYYECHTDEKTTIHSEFIAFTGSVLY